jgi:hypothetical protein
MPSDIAKVTLDYLRQYDTVVFQQGRVGLEADNNESSRLAAERLRQESAEIVGMTGTPDDGYAVSAGVKPYDLLIKHGTMYVDGVRVFAPADITYDDQSDWSDHQTDPLWRDVAGPADNELVALVLKEHEVGAIEDSALREVALGGPDTCARTKIVQHVIRLDTTKTKCADAMAELKAQLAQDGIVPDPRSLDASGNWSGGRLIPQGELQVNFQTSSTTHDACEPQAQGGYVQADNQMIRIKITSAGPPTSTLIWAYDGASFVYRAEVQDGTTLKLATTPVDDFHRPRKGQVVEILRAAARLYTGSNDGPGLLSDNDFVAALDGIVTPLGKDYDPDSGLITLSQPLPAEYQSPTDNPPFDASKKAMVFVRMWEQQKDFVPGTFASIGHTGVEVNFRPGLTLHAGSYWMVAVRPTTPTNVYPDRYLRDFQPAEGPRLWVCPLAVIGWAVAEKGVLLNPLDDCRNNFANLVELSKRCPPAADSWPTIKDIDWPNDQVVSLARFNQGFSVTMSRPMAPDTITEETFQVILDIINPPTITGFTGLSVSSFGRMPFFIRGKITPNAAKEVFTFQPNPQLTNAELSQFIYLQRIEEYFGSETRTPGVRCRIVLTGDTILDPKDNPLDGEAFGKLQQSATRPYTTLVMPSPGNGVKGGDFKSWLFVGLPPTVQVNPPSHTAFSTGSGPAHIDLNFSQPMAMATVQAGLTVTSSATGVVAGKFTAVSDTHATFQPTDNSGTVLPRFPDSAAGQSAVTYTIHLNGQTVVDIDGLQLDGATNGQAGTDFVSDFRVVASTRVARMDPTGNIAPNVPVRLITITFSGHIDTGTVRPQSITVADASGTNIPGTAQAVSATTATFTPTAGSLPIPRAKSAPITYTVTVYGTGANAIQDVNGLAIAGIPGAGPANNFTGTVTLLPLTGVEKIAPKNGSINPDGSVDEVVITFTANVNMSAVDRRTFTVSASIGAARQQVAGSVHTVPPRQIHFVPDVAPLPGGNSPAGVATYDVHLVGQSVVDGNGSPIDGAGTGVPGSDFTSSFKVKGSSKAIAKDEVEKFQREKGNSLENLGGSKAVAEVSVRPTARRRRTPAHGAGGLPSTPAAIGQPFIGAGERPVVGPEAIFEPTP